MKSPFVLIRKHQRTLLAGVTLLAIFTFVLGDWLLKGSPTQGQTDDVVVTTSAGELKRSDMDRLKSQRQIANQFIARAGTLSQVDPRVLRQYQFGFPGIATDFDKDILVGYLLSLEADKAGIVVSDDTVSDFISKVTNQKLGKEQFQQIVREMHIGQNAVYDAIRAELRAQIASRVFLPAGPLTPEQYWEIYKKVSVKQSMDVVPLSVEEFVKDVPEPDDSQLLEYFQAYKHKSQNTSEQDFSPGFKQPRKVDLQYIVMRFADVREEVEKSNPITDQEIEDYYEKNKDQYIDEIPSLDDVFSDDPSQDEAPAPPETDPKKSDADKESEPVKSGETPDDKQPAEKQDDKNKAPETPAPKEEPPKSEDPAEEPVKESPPEEEKSDPPSEKENEPEQEQPADDQPSPPSDGTSSTIDENLTLTEFVENQPEEPAETEEESGETAEAKQDAEPADAGAEETPQTPKDSDEPNDEQKSDQPPGPKLEAPQSDPAESKPSPEEQPSDSKKSDAEEPGKESPTEPPKPKYRELDDDLRDQIRTELLNQRTRAQLDRLADKVLDDVAKLEDQHAANIEPEEPEDEKERPIPPSPEKLRAEAEAAAKDLKRIAEDYHAEFGETGLISFADLLEQSQSDGDEIVTGDTIAQAVRVDDSGSARTNGRTTLELVSSSESLYGPYAVVGSVNNDRFVFWKVRDEKEHIPEWDEPGIREEVLQSWKMNEARKLARQQAEEWAKSAAGKEFAAAFPEGTASGKTQPFTWLTQPPSLSPNPFLESHPRIRVSEILYDAPIGESDGISNPGERFMKTVFDELNVDDVGVVENADRTMVYVVKIAERDLSDPDISGEDFMKQDLFTLHPLFRQLTPTPYDQLADRSQRELMMKWAKQLEGSYDVRWTDEAKNDGDS